MSAHARRCGCPLCIMADATLLLDRGKAGMASRVLEGQPSAIVAAVEAAHAKGVEEGRQGAPGRTPAPRRDLRAPPPARRSTPPPRPSKRQQTSTKPHQVLARALVEGRITPQRVAELLGIRLEDVPPIAAGRVGLSGDAWRKLMRDLA
jgi:hypothetical protein